MQYYKKLMVNSLLRGNVYKDEITIIEYIIWLEKGCIVTYHRPPTLISLEAFDRINSDPHPNRFLLVVRSMNLLLLEELAKLK